MKIRQIFLFVFLLSSYYSFSQAYPISVTSSANKKFSLKSIPYSSKVNNRHGISTVTNLYGEEIYSIDRSFKTLKDYNHAGFLALSNDGRKVLYIASWLTIVERKKNPNHPKQILYYVDGKLEKEFTEQELTGCDDDIEDCGLFYHDTGLENIWKRSTTKEFRKDVTEKDLYLYRNYVFNRNDTIYMVDGRKIVSRFNLDTGELIDTNIDFDSIYPEIRHLEVNSGERNILFKAIPKLKEITEVNTNKTLLSSIEDILNIQQDKSHTYHKFFVRVKGYLHKDGRFELEAIEAKQELDNLDKLKAYLNTASFTTDNFHTDIPIEYIDEVLGLYRSRDKEAASALTQKVKEQSEQERIAKKTKDSIYGKYVPKNMKEIMFEIDKMFKTKQRNILKSTDEEAIFDLVDNFIYRFNNYWNYHYRDSRIEEYLKERGFEIPLYTMTFSHNDRIFREIFDTYLEYNSKNNKPWKKWEKKNPVLKE